MSPIKFDENIKKELEKRTLPISEDVWKSFSKRFEPENKKSKISFWWMGIAASLILVLWLSKNAMTSSVEITPIIVNAPEKEEKSFEILNETNEIEPTIVVAVEKEKESVQQKKELISIKQITPKKEKELIANVEIYIVENKKREVDAEFKSFEDQKVMQIVAQISEMKKKNKTVTDLEIELLLRKAQDEISIQKLIDDNSTLLSSQTVNADMLLYQVESEINKSFRDKVFKELKLQFNSAKNAVAQRNKY